MTNQTPTTTRPSQVTTRKDRNLATLVVVLAATTVTLNATYGGWLGIPAVLCAIGGVMFALVSAEADRDGEARKALAMLRGAWGWQLAAAGLVLIGIRW